MVLGWGMREARGRGGPWGICCAGLWMLFYWDGEVHNPSTECHDSRAGTSKRAYGQIPTENAGLHWRTRAPRAVEAAWAGGTLSTQFR